MVSQYSDDDFDNLYGSISELKEAIRNEIIDKGNIEAEVEYNLAEFDLDEEDKENSQSDLSESSSEEESDSNELNEQEQTLLRLFNKGKTASKIISEGLVNYHRATIYRKYIIWKDT
jgi:DNA-binding NarL/FixJ family response regulator